MGEGDRIGLIMSTRAEQVPQARPLARGHQGGDARALKQKLGHRVSFWTGPSDTIHMPREDPDEVRRAVRHVFEVFGKTGLLITLCSSSKAVFPWANVLAMIEEWKNLR